MHIYNLLHVTEPDEKTKSMILKSIASNIRKIRLKRKMTQEEIAFKAGINPKYLSEVERGKKSPTALIVVNIARALNVHICEILSPNKCQLNSDTYCDEIERLLEGKDEKKIIKALKILEVFFEED